jgi:hypothetical protein
MANCRFNFMDSRGRSTSRTFAHVSDVFATVLAAAATLAALWDVLTDLQLVNVTISLTDMAPAFAGEAPSNIDENTSVKVLGADGRVYDVDLPDMPDSFTPSGMIDPTDPDIVAWFDEFGPASSWRVNLNNPTAITQIISGSLDK